MSARKLFDSGEADKLLFYVMPHVEGESLRDRLDREHQLPVDEAVRIAAKVAAALQAAHDRGASWGNQRAEVRESPLRATTGSKCAARHILGAATISHRVPWRSTLISAA
jgi:serine/threonine protein kinase